jgi:hypothetical protein
VRADLNERERFHCSAWFTRLQGDSFGRCLLKMLRQEYKGMEPPYEFMDIPR